MILNDAHEHKQFFSYEDYPFLKEKDFMRDGKSVCTHIISRKSLRDRLLIVHGIDGCIILRIFDGGRD